MILIESSAVNVFSLLEVVSDRTRLRILNVLNRGTLCVCDIEEALDLGQSNLSKHLRVLRDSGLVVGVKKGMFVYYSRAMPFDNDTKTFLGTLYDFCANQKELKADLANLEACIAKKKENC